MASIELVTLLSIYITTLLYVVYFHDMSLSFLRTLLYFVGFLYHHEILNLYACMCIVWGIVHARMVVFWANVFHRVSGNKTRHTLLYWPLATYMWNIYNKKSQTHYNSLNKTNIIFFASNVIVFAYLSQITSSVEFPVGYLMFIMFFSFVDFIYIVFFNSDSYILHILYLGSIMATGIVVLLPTLHILLMIVILFVIQLLSLPVIVFSLLLINKSEY